jgi:hypothetical protein
LLGPSWLVNKFFGTQMTRELLEDELMILVMLVSFLGFIWDILILTTNESLNFRIILTKITFVTASVAYLMLHPTCFVLLMPLDTFILPHVLVKCHLKAFVALPWSSEIFCRNRIFRFAKPDSLILIDLH